jgi:hypothetical protein
VRDHGSTTAQPSGYAVFHFLEAFMAKISFKKFIREVVELSTAHITRDDDWHLMHSPGQLIVHDLDPGWLIYLPRRSDDPDHWEALAKSEFSPALKSLLMKVEADGFFFIRLDPDATENPDLPTFRW